MPFMETFSPGAVKQSPAPQHHSPAAFRKPPRLIQRSCADASEPIANNAPTEPTSAIDRSVMAVPLRSNAALTSGFLDRHTGCCLTIRSRAGAVVAAASGAWNFIRAPAFGYADECIRAEGDSSKEILKEILHGEIARRAGYSSRKGQGPAVCDACGRVLAADPAGGLCGRTSGIRGRALQTAVYRFRTVRQSQRTAEAIRRRDQAARECRSRVAETAARRFRQDAGHYAAGQSGRRPERQAEITANNAPITRRPGAPACTCAGLRQNAYIPAHCPGVR